MSTEDNTSKNFDWFYPLGCLAKISLGIIQLLGLSIVIIALVAIYPQLWEILASFDLKPFSAIINLVAFSFLLVLILLFLALITYLIFLGGKFIVARLEPIYIRYRARQLSKVRKEQQFINQYLEDVLDKSLKITRDINYLKSQTHQAKRTLQKLRLKLRKVIRDLENDLNYLTDFLIHQFKDNTTEMLALLQVVFVNFFSSYIQFQFIEQFINFVAAILIFYIATIIKNSAIQYYTKILMLTLIQLLIVLSIVYIDYQINIVGAIIYGLISFVISAGIAVKIYRNRNRVLYRFDLSKYYKI